METNNKIQVITNKQQLPIMETHFLKALANIQSSDIAAYNAIHTGIAINNMSDKQQTIAVKGIVFNMAVITGCPVPNDVNHQKTLEMHTKKFLQEHDVFSKLTYEEICTAARFNAGGKFVEKVKHWQNMFNLDYLGEILTEWVTYKRAVEKKIEKEVMINNLFEPENAPFSSDNEGIEYGKANWQKTSDYLFIDSRIFNILVNWILRSKFTTVSAQSLPLVWSCCSGINLVVFSGPQ